MLERGGLDLPDIFARFQRWAADEPKDIGLQTEDVLTRGLPWNHAAVAHYRYSHQAAGNGALTRATPSAVYFARDGQQATMDAARHIAALTHGDPAAWEGTAIFHDLMHVALYGADPMDELSQTLTAVLPDHRQRYAAVLAPRLASRPGHRVQRRCLTLSRLSRMGTTHHPQL
ncbi:ADP-ribosylglycohydrolase family protein [Nonomuraea dietziae]|uniref:ADP-ribosylglycohydrolase family protein n=1 Tax=Nonomuraea dietziae TaxID=65515 RepID=UPI003421C0C8